LSSMSDVSAMSANANGPACSLTTYRLMIFKRGNWWGWRAELQEWHRLVAWVPACKFLTGDAEFQV
jgi:hypothetical protein